MYPEYDLRENAGIKTRVHVPRVYIYVLGLVVAKVFQLLDADTVPWERRVAERRELLTAERAKVLLRSREIGRILEERNLDTPCHRDKQGHGGYAHRIYSVAATEEQEEEPRG